MAGPITQAYGRHLRAKIYGWGAEPSVRDLEMLLRDAAKWRSVMLAHTYIAEHGLVIGSGLFAGMAYTDQASEGSLCARLFGVYEACLHPHILAFHAAGLDCAIDIGCAEGYYAVGLAYRFPGLEVYAHDIEPKALEACAELAARNGVADRVMLGGEFRPEDFQRFAGRRVLVMVDAEGAELDILRPDLAPALAGMGIIVETHDSLRPGALAELTARFSPTHEVIRVDRAPPSLEPPPWLAGLSELDQFIAQWEWRHRATPWLVMRPR